MWWHLKQSVTLQYSAGHMGTGSHAIWKHSLWQCWNAFFCWQYYGPREFCNNTVYWWWWCQVHSTPDVLPHNFFTDQCLFHNTLTFTGYRHILPAHFYHTDVVLPQVTLLKHSNMAAADTCQKQHNITEFLMCKNDTVTNIHKQLHRVYEDHAVDCRIAGHWNKHMPIFTTASQWQTSQQGQKPTETVNSIILPDRCFTVKELLLQLDTGEASIWILNKLGYMSVCVRWDPQKTDAYNWQRNITSHARPPVQDFWCGLMIMERNFWHTSWWEMKHGCTTSNQKQRDSQWSDMQILQGERSSRLHLLNVKSCDHFLGHGGVILVDIMTKGNTINPEAYVHTM